MKRLFFIVLITFVAISADAQTMLNVWGGGGIASRYNFDVAPEAGFDFTIGAYDHLGIGISAFFKNYSLYYDKEDVHTLYGTGDGGASIRNLSNFGFATVKLDYASGRHKNLHFYVKSGVGLYLGGSETLHTFQNSYISPPFITSTNDTVNTTKNIKSMVYYIGFGFTEYSQVKNKLFFTLTEDFGFLTSSITKTTDINYSLRNNYFPNSFNPFYVSITLGFAIKFSKEQTFIREY